MKKAIDREIHDLEQRMARRRHEVADSARLAKRRAVRKLASPTGLAVAAGLGFLVTVALLRKRQAPPTDRRKAPKPSRLAGALSLLMPLAVGVMRAQFGSPAGMAQFVLSKVQGRPSPAGDADDAGPAAPAGATRRARPPAQTVHLAR